MAVGFVQLVRGGWQAWVDQYEHTDTKLRETCDRQFRIDL